MRLRVLSGKRVNERPRMSVHQTNRKLQPARRLGLLLSMGTLFGSPEKKPEKKSGLFDRLKQAVASTKEQLVDRIEMIVEAKESIDQTVLDDLEATLIAADLGVKTT